MNEDEQPLDNVELETLVMNEDEQSLGIPDNVILYEEMTAFLRPIDDVVLIVNGAKDVIVTETIQDKESSPEKESRPKEVSHNIDVFPYPQNNKMIACSEQANHVWKPVGLLCVQAQSRRVNSDSRVLKIAQRFHRTGLQAIIHMYTKFQEEVIDYVLVLLACLGVHNRKFEADLEIYNTVHYNSRNQKLWVMYHYLEINEFSWFNKLQRLSCNLLEASIVELVGCKTHGKQLLVVGQNMSTSQYLFPTRCSYKTQNLQVLWLLLQNEQHKLMGGRKIKCKMRMMHDSRNLRRLILADMKSHMKHKWRSKHLQTVSDFRTNHPSKITDLVPKTMMIEWDMSLPQMNPAPFVMQSMLVQNI